MQKLKKVFLAYVTYPWILFLVLAFTYHTVQSYLAMGSGGHFEHTIQTYLEIIYGYLTFFTLFLIANGLTQKNRLLQVIANSMIVILFALTTAYFFGTDHSVDYSVLVETSQNALNKGSVEVVLTAFNWDPIIIGGAALLIFLIVEMKNKTITKFAYFPKKKSLLFCVVLYAFMVAGPLDTKDEVTHFFRTIYEYYCKPLYHKVPLKENEYPYLKDKFKYNVTGFEKERPPIFLIVIESFNEWAVDQKTETGKEIMPYFNELKKKGIYVDHFYGNSMLSIKGYSAMLTGVVPTFRGFMLEFKDTYYYGLPDLLKENGYQTLFFQSHLIKGFHHTGDLVKRTGIQEFETIEPYLRPEDEAERNKWGHRDKVLYRSFFEHLDKNYNDSSKPIFASVVTIYSHMRFKVPTSERQFYKEPKTQREHFANCMHLVDKDLKVFFEELQKRPKYKNAIIMITGDHSFPLGDHGITHAEVGFYDESFRVPFLMIWNQKLQPKEIKETVYSQIDIAPSLMDLLHLKATHYNFTGESIFAVPNKERPTFLIQPYSGTYTSVVRYPYKYIFHHRTRKEYLFNLKTDPKENINVINTGIEKENQLRSDLKTVFLNQQLIEEGKIFPKKLKEAIK